MALLDKPEQRKESLVHTVVHECVKLLCKPACYILIELYIVTRQMLIILGASLSQAYHIPRCKEKMTKTAECSNAW